MMTENNGENHTPITPIEFETGAILFGLRLPFSFWFWFSLMMVLASITVIIHRTLDVWITGAGLYESVFSGVGDIGATIPIVSLLSALLGSVDIQIASQASR